MVIEDIGRGHEVEMTVVEALKLIRELTASIEELTTTKLRGHHTSTKKFAVLDSTNNQMRSTTVSFIVNSSMK